MGSAHEFGSVAFGGTGFPSGNWGVELTRCGRLYPGLITSLWSIWRGMDFSAWVGEWPQPAPLLGLDLVPPTPSFAGRCPLQRSVTCLATDTTLYRVIGTSRLGWLLDQHCHVCLWVTRQQEGSCCFWPKVKAIVKFSMIPHCFENENVLPI